MYTFEYCIVFLFRSTSPIQTSVIQSTKNYSNKKNFTVEELNNQNNVAMNGAANTTSDPVIRPDVEDSDIEMETSDEVQNGHSSNKLSKSPATNGYQNGNSHSMYSENFQKDDEEMGMLLFKIMFQIGPILI